MALNALVDLLHRQAVLFTILPLVISPLLIYYVATLLFYRRVRSEAYGKVPPTVPYYVPGIFHAFSLAYIGPQRYFAQLMMSNGDLTPFFVNAGPQAFLILREPGHIKKLLAASKAATSSLSYLEMFDKVYGSPQAAVDLYAGKGTLGTDTAALEYAHVALTKKHLSGISLSTSVETYVSILSSNLNDKMFQVGTWTQIEDTWSFLQQVVSRCILESLFGSDLFKQYPGVVRDYWEFSEAFAGFIPGLPRYWVPSAASQVRDRLLQGIEKWLRANHSGSEFARIADEDPIWDRLKGSKFIQERDDALAKIKGMNVKARASEMLSIMHESNSTMVPCVFWTLVELHRRPQFVKALVASIDRYSPSQGATYNIHDITNLPLVDSIFAETVRLRMASIAVHTQGKTLQLDDHWIVPKDTPIVVFSHDISLNSEAWANARSRTVEKPLEEYWAERFLVSGRTESKASQRGQRNDASALSFDMEGLESLNINIGNGQQPVLGHDYMRAVHAASLAVLVNEFEVQLCDPEIFDVVVPPVREMAYGILKPVEKIAVRIRKR